MTDDTVIYDGTLERTSDGGVIRFVRRFEHPVRDVWDAITDPERIGDWWLPFDADITVDLREGGEMVFSARGDDTVVMTATIVRVEAPLLLEHTHVDPGSLVRWELESVGDGTVLRLSHFVTDVGPAIGGNYIAGLHTSFSRLAPLLDGHPVPWDWDAFAVAQTHYADLGFATPLEES